MKVSAVSGDLLVKLALGVALFGAGWYLVRKVRAGLGDAVVSAGNAAASVPMDAVHTAANTLGGGALAIVEAVGLVPYLKSISDSTLPPPVDSAIGYGVGEVNGQSFNFNF